MQRNAIQDRRRGGSASACLRALDRAALVALLDWFRGRSPHVGAGYG
jgi:hypothetical protein